VARGRGLDETYESEHGRGEHEGLRVQGVVKKAIQLRLRARIAATQAACSRGCMIAVYARADEKP
jgi:hypothetical protein